jgi:hypothetical protein
VQVNAWQAGLQVTEQLQVQQIAVVILIHESLTLIVA